MAEGEGDSTARMATSMAVCLAGSVIELSTAADSCSSATPSQCDDKDYAWAIACGAVSAAACIVRLLLFKFSPQVPPMGDMIFSALLALWWVFGAAFNTRVNGVFVSASNGYFGTWIAFFAAVFFAFLCFQRVQSSAQTSQYHSGFMLLVIAGAVELSVAADSCDKHNECTKKYAFAVAVGAVSVAVSIVHFLLCKFQSSTAEASSKYFALFFLCLWAAGAGVNTSINAPFQEPCKEADGYFSSWAAFLAALYTVATLFLSTEDVSKEHVAEHRLAIAVFVCFTASAIELATAADWCSDKDQCDKSKYAWAIACGAVSAVICLVRLVIMKATNTSLNAALDTVLSLFLVAWWVVGAALNTRVKGVFVVTSNGYFATWVALLAATYYAYLSVLRIQKALEGRTTGGGIVIVFAASLVVLAVAANDCDERDSCQKKYGWAVACGVVSTVISLAVILLKQFKPDAISEQTEKIISLFLVAWWAAGAGVNTSSNAPFSTPCHSANGYFASWTGMFAALFYCAAVFGFSQRGRSGYEQV